MDFCLNWREDELGTITGKINFYWESFFVDIIKSFLILKTEKSFPESGHALEFKLGYFMKIPQN